MELHAVAGRPPPGPPGPPFPMEAMGEMMEHLAARNAEAIEGVAQHVHMELQRVAGEVVSVAVQDLRMQQQQTEQFVTGALQQIQAAVERVPVPSPERGAPSDRTGTSRA